MKSDYIGPLVPEPETKSRNNEGYQCHTNNSQARQRQRKIAAALSCVQKGNREIATQKKARKGEERE